jgi:CheY-like chemotaxis protein
MSLWQGLKNKLGLANVRTQRNPIMVFLLDDDEIRHRWFARRFANDLLDIAENVAEAKELLSKNTVYDAIFLDHDLLPEHYKSGKRDDERTGYAIAAWLAEHPQVQPAAKIMVHTRNADAAIRMIEKLRAAGRQAEYAPYTMLEQRIKNYWKD